MGSHKVISRFGLMHMVSWSHSRIAHVGTNRLGAGFLMVIRSGAGTELIFAGLSVIGLVDFFLTSGRYEFM